ncbi:MAG: dicarboxylate/amino acid:cation symporter [Eubacteriales bacterium]|nr:dicarboxylate/amino acid:cation symporter [Eubacteriales bacterium]
MAKIFVPAALNGISKGLDFIEDTLKQYRLNRKEVQEALLLSEESMVRLINNAPDGEELHISVKRRRGLCMIKLSAPGSELSQESGAGLGLDLNNSDLGRDGEEIIRSLLLHAYADKIYHIRKGSYNFIEITAGAPERVFAIRTVISLVAALIAGLLLNLILPDTAKQMLDTYVLIPIENIFINCLKLITGPMVFFSIISAFSQYASFSDPGRVSLKVLGGYLCTSVIAIAVGWIAFRLTKPGMIGQLAAFASQAVPLSADQQPSFLATLIGIVPANIVEPFINMNMVQLIFLALLCGVAMGRAGEHSATLRHATDALCALCSKATSLLVGVIPIATFASTVSMLLNIGGKILLSLAEMVGAVLLGSALMIAVYCLVIGIVGRLNPVLFLRKYTPLIKEVFVLGSGANAIPKTIRFCKNALGISPRVYSFSIPFGAVANMDGNCIYLTVVGLFLARMCGVELFSNNILPLIFTILVLSVGAPTAPGSALLCLTVLLGQMGVSLPAVSIIFGVNAVMEMLQAVSNTTGDIAISLTVAKSEGLLDTEVYHNRSAHK